MTKFVPAFERFAAEREPIPVRFFPAAAASRPSAPPETLAERLGRGDPVAVAQTYDRHGGRVRAFCRNLLRDDAAAEDLVQETFVALPRAARRFRGESTIETFLVSIAINRARHYVRAAARRRKAHERFAEQPARRGPSTPEDERARRELATALARALDTLPIDQRVAFVLCAVEERSAREAADIVGVPHATMRTRLFHARKKLQVRLEAEGYR